LGEKPIPPLPKGKGVPKEGGETIRKKEKEKKKKYFDLTKWHNRVSKI
jgi:hypothetical protein